MILVGIPYHEQKRYCLNELFDYLRDAHLPDTEILIRIHNGTYGEKDAVKKQREFFRTQTLDHNFTHLFFVGADTIPPLDALPRLLAHGKDVVGGVYFGRHGAGNGLPNTAVAWRHSQPDFNTRENLEKQTELQKVDGMGMDCVLFSRKTLEGINFTEHQVNDDDYPVYDKLIRQGFEIYLDPTIICKHYSSLNTYS